MQVIRMTTEEFEDLELEELISILIENDAHITDEETLKEFIIKKVQDDDWYLATHLLNYIWENGTSSEYYIYDYSMGTLDNPTPIDTKEDLEDFIDFI